MQGTGSWRIMNRTVDEKVFFDKKEKWMKYVGDDLSFLKDLEHSIEIEVKAVSRDQFIDILIDSMSICQDPKTVKRWEPSSKPE